MTAQTHPYSCEIRPFFASDCKPTTSRPVNRSGDALTQCYLAELSDDAEGVPLQEAVVEGEDVGVVQLGQQLGLLRRSHRLVRSKVAQRNLLQHLPEETEVRGQTAERRTSAGFLF